ncbi:RNA polymerase sigma factor [Pseudobacter ginsenosidimutans]|mgnify:CR=1 FL=1|uniref:RNA polymerase sigma-70 factor (ECF subfamily) n=1 Tax=Pseudobacter ginsenosidimutans TaxID=661488 RepID=A0A4Q7ML99_9BACT|nr:sigma-70 family RNA polymerase sigma factor [Pseudobacter ginsenosidimutans]QEC40310.1 sigma-70 family RNA polymerase sigma factor [Pseudobacter ginsenosidimutans]RZS69086.1 RNA polymerase sigma-70 factor (ECF subfamily) [Pseudobacter ginsenosidimutans]
MIIGGYYKDELEFIHAFHLKEERSFNLLFDEFYSEIVYFSYKLTNNEAVAEEIVADSFMKVFNRSTAFPSIANIKSFLYITSRNACFDYLSREKTRSRNNYEFLYFMEEEDGSPLDFERMNAELIATLHKEIKKLPPLSQKVITLRVFEQLEPNKVAEVLGISYQTVKNQTWIATNRLKNSLPLLKKHVAEFVLAIVSSVLF